MHDDQRAELEIMLDDIQWAYEEYQKRPGIETGRVVQEHLDRLAKHPRIHEAPDIQAESLSIIGDLALLVDDIDAAVEAHEAVLQLVSLTSPEAPRYLLKAGEAYLKRYARTGLEEDRKKALKCLRVGGHPAFQ